MYVAGGAEQYWTRSMRKRGAAVNATKPHVDLRPLRFVAVAVLALGALIIPAMGAAGAEQIRITLVDEPAPWEFDDPCTGEPVHGLATESGTVHIADLGDQGHHVRVEVDGTVDLFDDEENFVGTWTYHLNFGDKYPPDAQGAVLLLASGPIQYADGHTAVITVHEHFVLGKGDIQKREFLKVTCR
jgi:hypothetical protein